MIRPVIVEWFRLCQCASVANILCAQVLAFSLNPKVLEFEQLRQLLTIGLQFEKQ
jgi:hypothetical protein